MRACHALRRCISILQTPRNKADAPKLRDRLLRPAYRSLGVGRRTSAFLPIGFITHWVKTKTVQKIICTPSVLENITVTLMFVQN